MRDLTRIPFAGATPPSVTVKQKNIKVSVVIPVYDTERKRLEACLGSCVNQSMDKAEYEIIVVDDGSKRSDTLRVAEAYARRYPSLLRAERLPQNRGVSAARNRGVARAVGTYIFFADSDDYIGAEALERMYKFGKAHNADLINGRYGEAGGRWRPPYGDDFGNVARADLHGHDVAYMSTVHRMFRRAKIEELRLRFDTKIVSTQDAVFLCTFLAHTNKICNLFDYDCYFLTATADVCLSAYKPSPAEFAYWMRARLSAVCAGNLRDKDAQNRHAAIGFAILFKRFVRDLYARETPEDRKHEALSMLSECVRAYLPQEADAYLEEDMKAALRALRDFSPHDGAPRTDAIPDVTWREYPAGRIAMRHKREPVAAAEAKGGADLRIAPAAKKSGIPDVSFVLPIFNVEQYLRAALDSVVGQTLQNIEIICVNDGSTDGSPGIIREYADRDGRIVFVDKPNAGYGHAMNRGMDRARGKYVAILEPDDYIARNMAEELFAVAVKHDLDIVKSDFNRFVGEGGSLTKTPHKCCDRPEHYNVVLKPAEHLEIFRYVMNTWCGIYRRGFLEDNKIRHNETPGASFQDNGFYFQTMCLAERIMYVDRQYYMNRRDNPNSSVKDKKKVYAVNEEHVFVNDFLNKSAALNTVYKGVHFLRKFGNYKFTLSRIDEAFHHEYLQRISNEFKEDLRLGNIDRKILNAFEWHDVRWIIRDPYEYYHENIKQKIKVSVIVPVYNAEKHLRQCIESIVGQSLKETEIILVDDGSSDGSLAIIEEFALKDSRIKVLTQDRLGAGAARNLGLDAAKGKYLSFLDADDFFDPAMLKKAYNKAAVDGEAVLCMFKARRYDNSTGETAPIPDALRIDKLPKHRPFSINHVNANIFSITKPWLWNKLFKRSFVVNNDIRFQEISSTNDLFFTFSALVKAPRITVLDEELVSYRMNNDASIQNNLEKSWENFYLARKEMKRELSDTGVFERYKKAFANFVLDGYFWFLKKLNSLDANAAGKFFDEGLTLYFKEFGIAGHTAGYFENKGNFERYKIMEKLGCGGFGKFIPHL